jgi:hypothetical protein
MVSIRGAGTSSLMVSIADIKKDLPNWLEMSSSNGCFTLPMSRIADGLRLIRWAITDGMACLEAIRFPGGKRNMEEEKVTLRAQGPDIQGQGGRLRDFRADEGRQATDTRARGQ